MDYYKLISEAIMEGEASETMQYTKEALGLKYPPENILKNGLMAGINTIAEKFKDEAVLIPEVLMSTRALHAGLKVLQPYLEVKGKKGAIKIVIGTVYGDLHDVGKNIIKALLTTMNVEVIDLGIDVSVSENFIQAIEKEKPDILMMSSLLTTTMNQMQLVIEELKKRGLREDLTIFIGGGPFEIYLEKNLAQIIILKTR
ncbi:MAG: cobalamin-dependent protein [Intestinibacter bartlettii]